VRENLGHHGGLFDGREEGQGAAALRTGGEVDREDPFESLGPAHAGPRGSRGGIAGVSGGVRCLVGLTGNNLGSKASIGCEHTMDANEMEPGTRNECRQALQVAMILVSRNSLLELGT
jgi:hypothetical protein